MLSLNPRGGLNSPDGSERSKAESSVYWYCRRECWLAHMHSRESLETLGNFLSVDFGIGLRIIRRGRNDPRRFRVTFSRVPRSRVY